MIFVPFDRIDTNYRNFNLCRHCIGQGEEGLLPRLTECMPMISRSDGKLFHLVLADQPAAYPAERKSGQTGKLSAFFWYSHVFNANCTRTSLVILPKSTGQAGLFRRVEYVADMLADKLRCAPELETMYELCGEKLLKLPV